MLVPSGAGRNRLAHAYTTAFWCGVVIFLYGAAPSSAEPAGG